MAPQMLNVFAPAKLNLYLHITGKHANGYHELDSLMGFVDVGDELRIAPAPRFSFHVEGPFAKSFSSQELDASPTSGNLVVRALYALAQRLSKSPDVAVTLIKNLPLASGLGGGSADAAALLRGMMEWWNVRPENVPGFDELLLALGAEMPLCFHGRPAFVRGIGEVLEEADLPPDIPVLLANPGILCSTAAVFSAYEHKADKALLPLPEAFTDRAALINFLALQNNDLYETACNLVPAVADVIETLKTLEGCRLARMSGAGATCFALFDDVSVAKDGAQKLTAAHPSWWVRHGCFNCAS